MKYFTLAWWIQGGPAEAAERYWAYLDAVRPRLPGDLARLFDDVSLHDARLRTLDIDVAGRRLDLRLDGYRYTPRGLSEGARSLVLSYAGLRWVHSTADPEQGLGGPHGYGDLGYDEIELLPDGSVEHRLLFSSGIELTITFERFRLAYQDAVPGGVAS